jgi:hypothetical protein
MLEKKLTAMGCVAGILILGACGASPPPPPRRPPPPPLPSLEAHETHSILVAVKNGSESHQLAPSDVARAMVFNWRGRYTGIKVHIQSNAGLKDALLEITILSESTSLLQPSSLKGKENLTLDVRLSATLTSQNGDVLWHQQPTQISQICPIGLGEATEAWKDPKLRECVADKMSREIVNRMLDALEELK